MPRCNLSHEDVIRSLQVKITESASKLRSYFGLNEGDIPCLVILCLADRKAIVLQWARDDGTPYAFFKKIMLRSPEHSGSWLSVAVEEVAKETGRDRVTPLALKPEVLKDWEAVRYLPRGLKPLGDEIGPW